MKNNISQQFETPRLILKPTDTDDAAFILNIYNSPKWLRFIGDRNIRSETDAINYIVKNILPSFEKLGFGNYVIIEKNTNTKIGICGLYDREGVEGVDLGFAFLPDFEGKGYGTECATKLIEVAKDVFGLKELCAITNVDNENSQKLLKKLGFVYQHNIILRQTDVVQYYTLKLNQK